MILLYIYMDHLFQLLRNLKFLGILLDRKFSFIPHIKYLKAKCLKALNLLKVLSHTSWGADWTTLLKIYQSLVRSKLVKILAHKEIVLCWIPSHIGIQGNEMVDKQAKTSLSFEPTAFKISFSNFKPSINKCILDQWQTS